MDAPRKSSTKGEIIMSRPDLDRRIVAARPDTSSSNADFTDAVMSKINNNEIFSASIRNMDVTKKETFMMKLKTLPKFAMIAVALGALLLLSGTAYAAYQLLWAKPHVELTELTTSTSGREEAILSTKQCGPSEAQRYELKKGAPITADRIPAIVQAQCEMQAIQTWAYDTYGNNPTSEPKNGEPYDHTSAVVPMATKVEKLEGDTITFASNDRYNQPAVTYTKSSNVIYIVDGKESNASAIHVGDTVAYVLKTTLRLTKNESGEYSGGGMPEETLVAVVKLSMPFEDYDQFAWQSLTEREICYGNPDDLCLTGYSGAIDIYMRSGNPDFSSGEILTKEIQGVITQINGNTFTLKSSSGSLFTITTPKDEIANFNTNRSAEYSNIKIKVGSTVSVHYTEKESEHSKTIGSDKVFWFSLKLEMVRKGDPIKPY